MIETATAINTLRISPEANFVSSSDQSITVSLADLRQIITEAVQDALLPLQDEVIQLRAIVARQDERIGQLEARISLQEDNALRVLDRFDRLKDEVKTARKEPEEESPLLDELYKEMVAIGRKQTDFATAARMVKRSKSRMLQLKAAIALDQRFILVPSKSHSQRNIIRLREKQTV